MSGLKHRYVYEGPVMIYNQLASNNWKGETVAPSEKKAKSNLCYQVKKEAKVGKNARVTLLGKIKELEVVM
jgi:hypothetical protein